ncbi:unnamed protein product [Trichogramma brassicae]|uniref:AT-rich interactive domain-containing protein 5B n=1 Tax=Trichogramma brassicae TaxID=86971 RepID=A0A6H5IY72_9HYME|nr:unnamed protein product [Trichogramma brassicae]
MEAVEVSLKIHQAFNVSRARNITPRRLCRAYARVCASEGTRASTTLLLRTPVWPYVHADTRASMCTCMRLDVSVRAWLLGGSCFSHGPYTFYKGVRLANGLALKLGSFFLTKLWNDADLVCIGELQLLWIDNRGPNTPLASLRLYFLPENTPEGRKDTHGERLLQCTTCCEKEQEKQEEDSQLGMNVSSKPSFHHFARSNHPKLI